jgi:hypothetical protein
MSEIVLVRTIPLAESGYAYQFRIAEFMSVAIWSLGGPMKYGAEQIIPVAYKRCITFCYLNACDGANEINAAGKRRS